MTVAERTPMQGLTALLTEYFDGHSVTAVKDPWSRILDGFLVRVHITMWPGRVALSAEDFGLPTEEYEKLAGKVRWGSLDLLPDSIGGEFDSVSTLSRGLPRRWGRDVHWGRFVPLAAMEPFKEQWAALEQRWQAAIDAWVCAYDDHRAQATERAAQFAAQAWKVANRLDNARLSSEQYSQLDAFVDAMVPRIMGGYPTATAIRERYTMDYRVSFIPTPAMEAEQAAHAELVAQAKVDRLAEMRREAEQAAYDDELQRLRTIAEIDAEQLKSQKKIELVEKFASETKAKLKKEQARLLAEFYNGYAVDIRQRLHESLMLLVEGCRTGKIRPQTTRSLRVVLDEIKVLALDDDAEIQQMRQQLAAIVGRDGPVDVDPAVIRQQAEDLGVLLQTEILALGDRPRLVERMAKDGPIDLLAGLPDDASMFAEEIARRRQRVGLDSSLAETLVAGGELTPGDLRRRRMGVEL